MSTFIFLTLPLEKYYLSGMSPKEYKQFKKEVQFYFYENLSAYRAEKHRINLETNPFLENGSQSKLDDMIQKRYYGHDNHTGEKFDIYFPEFSGDRLIGENILFLEIENKSELDPEHIAKKILSLWLNSEEHRKNILSPRYASTFFNFDIGYIPHSLHEGKYSLRWGIYATNHFLD